MRYSSTLATVVVMLAVAVARGAEPAANTNYLVNGDVEAGKGEMPSIWFEAKVPADGLFMRRDVKTAHAGKASLCIENNHRYDDQVCNNWAQKLNKTPIGKTLEVSGWIKSQDADSVNICIQCWDAGQQNMLAFGSTPVVRGDQDWTQLSTDPVIVPEGTKSILVRAVLTGLGKTWFDDLAVTESSDTERTSSDVGPDPDLLKQIKRQVIATVPIAKDQMILAYMPDWGHGRVDNIAVANNQGGVRTMLDWGKLDPKFAEAQFILACYSRETHDGKEPSKLGAYEIVEDFSEQTPWTRQPKTGAEPAQKFSLEPGTGWKLFDVTSIAQAQIKQARPIHGVMLRFETEDKSPDDWAGYAFVSREGAGEWARQHPVLLVVK